MPRNSATGRNDFRQDRASPSAFTPKLQHLFFAEGGFRAVQIFPDRLIACLSAAFINRTAGRSYGRTLYMFVVWWQYGRTDAWQEAVGLNNRH